MNERTQVGRSERLINMLQKTADLNRRNLKNLRRADHVERAFTRAIEAESHLKQVKAHIDSKTPVGEVFRGVRVSEAARRAARGGTFDRKRKD